METALKIESLYFSYDHVDVLVDINLELKNGSFLALIGPNGGGKSTLLKLIIGLLEPKRGKVTIFGKKPKDIYSQIGYVPQNTNQNLEFPITTLDVVLMGHDTKRRPLFGYGKKDTICALSALEQVGMKEFANKKIGSLSGGERQRVLIARALCSNPRLLILDEPTSNIDIDGQARIFELLKNLNSSLGITIILVSHEIAEVLSYATLIGYINKRLMLHEVHSLQNKSLIDSLRDDSGHLCEVDLLLALSNQNK